MNLEKAQSALQHYFGYTSFRPMQQEVVKSLYQGKDVLLLMPTGGGKSICFQIPAITMEGVGIVVSPLIALMQDQVNNLKSNGVSATFLNSTQTTTEQRLVEEGIYDGKYDLVYVSPEKVVSQDFSELLSRIKVCLFAIDEAHCISSWGHDFRPEYAQLKFLKQHYPKVPIIACTATADQVTRRDIIAQLQLPLPNVFVASFDRPNLRLEVRSGTRRFEQIVNFLTEHPNQSGIIYCLSRKSTETVANKLIEKGFSAAAYHAGMSSQERHRVQTAFTKDETPIICATIAFGMGIDKSNVRWVIHYNMPKNIEGFYQEIGRSGRDGAAANTLLFYSLSDVMTWREIIENSEQREIWLAKLSRMQQYATSMFCRRKVLLNYFNEDWRTNCGNCDVCDNPPNYFDGTVTAQKALSAIYRTKEQIGINLLIDVLRGSKRKEIFEQQLDKIKTYGAGADLSFEEWRYYLEQMLEQGYIDIAHDDKNKVKLTKLSHDVLFQEVKVLLVKMRTAQERKQLEKEKANKEAAAVRHRVRDDLFDYLLNLRRQLAQLEGMPPYLIFSDVTLEEMAAMKPITEADMKAVAGVGALKWQKYGLQFLDAIKQYCKENNITPPERRFVPKPSPAETIDRMSTFQMTYQLFKEGLSLEEIAEQRNLKVGIITGHLLKLKNEGKDIDLTPFVAPEIQQKIINILPTLPSPPSQKDIFLALNEEVPYYKIMLTLAIKVLQE